MQKSILFWDYTVLHLNYCFQRKLKNVRKILEKQPASGYLAKLVASLPLRICPPYSRNVDIYMIEIY